MCLSATLILHLILSFHLIFSLGGKKYKLAVHCSFKKIEELNKTNKQKTVAFLSPTSANQNNLTQQVTVSADSKKEEMEIETAANAPKQKTNKKRLADVSCV